MTPALTVGIDLGTTATKVTVFDAVRGVGVATAGRSSTTFTPGPGWAEADTAQWWDNVAALVPAVLADAGAGPDHVAAVSVASMIPAVIVADDSGRALRRAILQNDARASVEIDEVRAALADVDVVATTGSPVTQQSVAPTWRWLVAHEPALVDSTKMVLGGAEWMAVALGATPHLERNWALESGLYTVDGDAWSGALAAAGLDVGLLLDVVPCGAVVGEVSATTARAVGLRAGTSIVAGGADHVLSAAAAGVASAGDALVKLGGAGDLLVFSERLILDERIYVDAHPVPGAWLPNGCMATSGSLLRWVQSLLGGVDLATLDGAAAGCRPGEVFCLPHFLGEKSPVHDPDLRGAFLGLHLGHGGEHLYRAALEAVAFGFRWMLDAFADAGLAPTRTFVSNGGSASTLWKQIVADVTRLPLHPVIGHAGASYGAALAAAIGVGLLGSWADAAGLAATASPIVPDPLVAAAYGDAYSAWHDARRALTPISHQLAARQRH